MPGSSVWRNLSRHLGRLRRLTGQALRAPLVVGIAPPSGVVNPGRPESPSAPVRSKHRRHESRRPDASVQEDRPLLQQVTPTPSPTPAPGTISLPEEVLIEQPEQAPLSLQAFSAQALSVGAGVDKEIATGSQDQLDQALAFNAGDDEYLVVWVDSGPPASLHDRRVTTAGNLIGVELTISSAGVGDPVRPSLAYSPTDNSYLLIWAEPNGGTRSDTYCADTCVTVTLNTNDLYALPLAADGTPQAGSPTLLSSEHTAYPTYLQNYDIQYNSSSNEYLAIWTQPPGALIGSLSLIVHPHTIKGQRIAPDGSLLGSTSDLLVGTISSLSVAYSTAQDQYLVSWDRQLPPPSVTRGELYGQRFDPGSLAAVGSEINLSAAQTGLTYELFGRLAYAESSDAYLIAYDSATTLTPLVPDIRTRAVEAATGDLLASDSITQSFSLADFTGDLAFYPQDDLFQLAFTEDYSHLTTAYLSAAGEKVMGNFRISESDLPAAAPRLAARSTNPARNRSWFVVWGSTADVYGQATLDPVLYDDSVLTSSGSACTSQAANAAQGVTAAPINTRTGSYDYAVQDLAFPTSAGSLSFSRSYSSFTTGTHTEPLGPGWTHNHQAQLVFPTDPGGEPEVVLFQADTANRVEFLDNGDGTFTPALGVCGSLTRDDGPPVTYTVTDEAQRQYVFDDAGRIQSWFDAQGRPWSYQYDVNGRLAEIGDDSGDRFLLFSYDGLGRLTLIEDHAERQVTYVYDANGDLAEVIDVLGQSWTYSYDANHLLTEAIDPRGITVERTEFDAQGRALRQYDGLDNLVVELTYNPDGTTTIVNALGNADTHAYDYRGTLTDETDPNGGNAATQYGLNFRPAAMTDEAGDTTALLWSYDGSNLDQVVDAEGGQTDLSYDALNNLTSATDPRGFTTSYTYDGTLLTSSTEALGNTTTYSYTLEGFLESVTDARGNATSYSYDAYGQRTSMTNAELNSWTSEYDDLGRLTDGTDPLDRVTHNEYDDAGRLTRTVRNYDPFLAQNEDNQFNIVTEYEYDAVGNLTAEIDSYGQITFYDYDDTNRLVRTTD